MEKQRDIHMKKNKEERIFELYKGDVIEIFNAKYQIVEIVNKGDRKIIRIKEYKNEER